MPICNDKSSVYYRVIINHEGQYSFWPLEQELPVHWSDTSIVGTKNECLQYIEQVWTDLRPLSTRIAAGKS